MITQIKRIVDTFESELRELQEGWYAEGYADGHDKAIQELTNKGDPITNKLDEPNG